MAFEDTLSPLLVFDTSRTKNGSSLVTGTISNKTLKNVSMGCYFMKAFNWTKAELSMENLLLVDTDEI